MSQIWIASTVFTAIVMALVAIVLLAHRLLMPSGRVSIVINGKRTLRASAGKRLLWELAAQHIYLPAACGGRGTCGQCRISVTGDVRPLLPTEAAHVDRRQAAQGIRLACMLTLQDDMEIRVPDDVLDVQRWTCSVVSNRNLTTFLKELVLALPDGETIEFEAGDYVLLEAPPHRLKFSDFHIDPEYRKEWERYQLFALRSEVRETTLRAYSLANHPLENRNITLVVRIATPPHAAPPGTPPGQVSSYVFSLKPDDRATVSGPFGEFHARDTDREMVLIAGGAGIAPMRSIIFDQLLRVRTTRKISFWYGARNLQEICYEEDFDRLAERYENFSWHIALSAPRQDDAWTGPTGLIHNVAYQDYLRDHPAPEEGEYYLCGPPLMSAAARQMLEDLGVESDSIFFDDFGG
jgi:Na+-transporting NADH:ubiquinone oxidoreductase subunit F